MEEDIYYDEYGDYNDSDYHDGSYADWMEYSYPADIASQRLNTFLPPILLFMGTLGNVILTLVLVRLSFKVLTLCFYLSLQGVADTLVLYIRCGNTWMYQMIEVDITQTILNRSNTSCQVYSFISNFLLHLCAWMLMAALVEAAMVTARPLSAHKTCTVDRTKNVVLLILLVLVCANAHFFWTYGLEQDYTNKDHFFCTFTTFGNHHSEHFRGIVWPIMDLFFASLLPGLIIFGCIVVIVRKRVQRTATSDTVLQNIYLLDPVGCYDMVSVCMVLGIFSLLFTLPEVGYNIFAMVFEKLQLTIENPEFYAYQNLAITICLTFRDIFLSSKFFIFIFWRSFRLELRYLCCRRKKKPNLLLRSSTSSNCHLKPVETQTEELFGNFQQNTSPDINPEGVFENYQNNIKGVDLESTELKINLKR